MKKLITIILAVGAIALAAFAAEVVSTDTVTVTTTNRTRMIHVFSEYGTPYRAEFVREELKTLPDNSVLAAKLLPSVSRTVSAVHAETVTLTSGKVLTVAEVAEALQRLGDKWAAEDATPPPSEP